MAEATEKVTEEKKIDNFVNLHVHSVGSLLDGMVRHNELVDYTLELGQPASCITDHGNLYSIVNHFQYAKKHGQKPIAGFEAYVVADHTIKSKDQEAQVENENKREHLLLLAKNMDGYKRLMKICSKGLTDGFYYRPRIDDNILKEFGTEGIIACSACFAGRVAQHIFNNRIEEAEKEALFYYELFNHDFYLEIQPTIDEKQVIVNRGLIELHKKTGIPMVATTDSHYLKREDSLTHDVLLCIQSKKLLSDTNRWKFPGDTYFVMSREEVINAFKCNGHETLDQDIVLEAINNTVKIANECNVELEFGKHYLPEINPPEDDEGFNKWANKFNKEANPDNYLRYLCIKGLKEKNRTDKEYRDRLEYELEVITSMGFSSYFLIMEDLMTAAKNMQVKTGFGRGCPIGTSIINLKDRQDQLCNVKIGDIVTGHDEKLQKVIKTHEYDCDEEIVKFDISSKEIPGITKDHEIYAIKKEDYDKGIRIPKWYKSDELNIGDYIAEL